MDEKYHLLFVCRSLSLKAWLVERYLKLLQYWGRAPKEMEEFTSKLKTLHDLDRLVDNTSKSNPAQPSDGAVSGASHKWDIMNGNHRWLFNVLGGTLPDDL